MVDGAELGPVIWSCPCGAIFHEEEYYKIVLHLKLCNQILARALLNGIVYNGWVPVRRDIPAILGELVLPEQAARQIKSMLSFSKANTAEFEVYVSSKDHVMTEWYTLLGLFGADQLRQSQMIGLAFWSGIRKRVHVQPTWALRRREVQRLITLYQMTRNINNLIRYGAGL